MEGEVFALGDDLVGKVWFDAQIDDLALKQAFYDELAGAGLPYETPMYEHVHDADGTVLSIERRLPGHTLKSLLDKGEVCVPTAFDALVQVVVSLAGTRAGPRAAQLRVMSDTAPFRRGGVSWAYALARLVEDRGRRFGGVLGPRVGRFEEKLDQTVRRLADLADDSHQVVHGDLVPENILVDSRGKVLAVLDWSFFTVTGDNTFDASTGAGIFDMYGPRAREHDQALRTILSDQHGYPLDLMLVYRAAYAISTANAFSADGSDGHFAWCASHLELPEVVDALQLN
jgi:Phosphotransferase enzyme family